MATANQHFRTLAPSVDGLLKSGNRGNGPDRHPRQYVLASGNAARNAPGMIGGEFSARQKNIVIACAARARGREAVANFHALDRANAHQRMGNHGIKLVEYGLPKA